MYLAIDLGDKRCGIAVYLEWIVVPKEIVVRPKLISYVKQLIWEYNIETIVVWLPYDLYGKDLRQLEKTQKFIEKLKEYFPHINIEWFDERFSSFEADRVLSQMWVTQTQWKKDAISASIILEGYLQQKNKI